MYVRRLLTAVPIMAAILASLMPSPLQATACWTVMVYLDGDNNLEPAAVDDLNEMEAVGSTDKVNIVVQFDRHPAYDNSNSDWTTTRQYYVTKDTNGYDTTITSTLVSDLGEKNMGDPNELISFVNWAMGAYPAEHYLLVLWDHGSGWKGIESVKSVCVDDTDNDQLDTDEVETALDSVTCSGTCPLDIVGFDACLMGMVEIDYAIMPYAYYRVGSEEYEPGDGWDYVRMLSYLTQNPYTSAEALSGEIVRTYMNFYGTSGYETQSAVDLNPTSTVVEALNTFALHLSGAETYESQVQTARSEAEAFSDLDYIDLYHFAQLVRHYVPVGGIQKDCEILMAAIQEAVTAEGHGFMNANAHGMSIYFPSTSAGYLQTYDGTDLSEDTFWEEFLSQYYNPSYPLDAALSASPDKVKGGDSITVTMTVTNTGANTITMVTPSPLTITSTGSASATLVSGPTPGSSDLAGGGSTSFTWVYQAVSGTRGGTLTFWGNAHGKDSVSSEEVFSPVVSSNTVNVLAPPVIVVKPPPNSNEQMQPVASHRIQQVRSVLESLQQQAAAAEEEGKNVEPCKEKLDLAEEYLQRAQDNYEKGNYIAANYWALQATEALEEAEECLENL